MRNYLAFVGKELMEGIRAYKALVLVAVFVVFGIMNPLFAKLTPDLLTALSGDVYTISVPEPTALDSWTQFFKNASQMGLIIVVILYSGVLAQEVNRGTLVIMLTKGLSRTTVVMAKYSMMILVWTLAYALCACITFGYTVYLFPENNTDNLVFAVFALWLFGVLLLSFMILAASATKNTYVCMLATGVFVAAMAAIGVAPATHDYNPLSLAGDSAALMVGTVGPADLLPAILVALGVSCLCVVGAVLVFRKRRL